MAHGGGIGAGTQVDSCCGGANEQDGSGGGRIDRHGRALQGVDDDAVSEVGGDGNCCPDVGAVNVHVSRGRRCGHGDGRRCRGTGQQVEGGIGGDCDSGCDGS